MSNAHVSRGAGGTPGGILEFVFGVVMAVVGAYLITSRVMVRSSFGMLWGYNSFGLSLLPLLVGIGMIFFNGRSPFGWLLVGVGGAIVAGGILMNMQIYFQPTSLFNTMVMLGLCAGGLGLILRAVQPH